MNLLEGIEVYIRVRRSEGAPWTKGAQTLRALCRQIGDVPIERIRPNQVVPFFDGSPTADGTWYNKYCVMRQFFRYWMVRNEIYSLPLPPPRRAPAKVYVPYVYSRDEIRRLLVASRITEQGLNFVIGSSTFRTLLLFLYATGAGISEAVQLERGDVDFRRRRITFHRSLAHLGREIPIGSDIYDILLRYHRTHHQGPMSARQFFLTKNGAQLKPSTASKTFQRVRWRAGIVRCDGERYQPRMRDLRNTFAVHRLTAWIRNHADMGRMIPALSAYMGQHDLAAAERYLRLTPERFRVQLNKLSPKRGKKRWREDAALMAFLEDL